MEWESWNDPVVPPKKTENSRSELEIAKITLQLASDLRSICVQKWVCDAWRCDLFMKKVFPLVQSFVSTQFQIRSDH
jgi:hypothetical protein